MQPPKLFEPYRKDKDAWDWKILTLVGFMFGTGSLERLLGGVALVISSAVLLLCAFLAYCMFTRLLSIYRTRAFKRTQSGYILLGNLGLCLLTLILSIVLYLYDIVSWDIAINGVGYSWLVFMVVTIGVEKYETYITARRAPPQLPNATPNIASYLKWKPKQPSVKSGDTP